MTRGEGAFFRMVNRRGFEVLFDYPIHPYWISFYFPASNVGVQLFKSSRPPSWWRHEYIERQGVTMLYLPMRWVTGDHRPGRSRDPRWEKIGKLIDAIEGRRGNPAKLREEFVIGCYVDLPAIFKR